MNVDQIYRFQRDEAFAKQFTAPSYTTFVAMPFGRTDEYDADNIYRLLKDNVHLRANALRQGLPRPFSPLERASEHKGTALVITELITTRILEDHFLVADLTGNNAGVILETGIALALKPNRRLVLITQDRHDDLHFDLKVTNALTVNGPYDFRLDLTKLLANKNVAGCGDYKYRNGITNKDLYIVACSSDGRNWITYRVSLSKRTIEKIGRLSGASP